MIVLNSVYADYNDKIENSEHEWLCALQKWLKYKNPELSTVQ